MSSNATSDSGWPRALRRRELLAGLVACVAAPDTSGAATTQTPRIVCLDYALAATAIAIGVAPVGIASMADWPTWVIEPELPPVSVDIGSAWEVNFEVLSALKPDLILNSPFGVALDDRLREVAPVLSLGAYTVEGGDVLPKAIAVTRKVGEALSRADQAEALIERADRVFESCHARLTTRQVPPLVVVRFMDQRHVQVYSAPGLFGNVLAKLGIRTAWPAIDSFWGFETVPIEALARVQDPSTRMIVLEPFGEDIGVALQQSGLWQALPFSKPGQFSVLPGSLMFGMLTDAMRFARILTLHLEETTS